MAEWLTLPAAISNNSGSIPPKSKYFWQEFNIYLNLKLY